MDLAVRDVHPGRIQLRRPRQSLEFYEIQDSVDQFGVLQPILVRWVRDRWEIIDGHYRWAASVELHLERIPAIRRDMTDEEVRRAQVQLNKIHTDVSKSDYRSRIEDIISEQGVDSLPSIGYALSKNIDWVANVLGLDSLDGGARKYAENGKLSIQAAILLAKLPPRRQRDLLADALSGNVEVLRKEAKSHIEFKQTKRATRRHSTQVRLRPAREVYREYLEPENAMSEITKADAVSAFQGWKLALKWVMRLGDLNGRDSIDDFGL